jgi:S-adenosylmethionine:tRNA ribosyltransferase-isomerase
VAVGTTVIRALESYNSVSEFFFTRESHPSTSLRVPSKIQRNFYTSFVNSTQLFIYPPYHFKMVDCLITNFHLPKSSLMMLVEAFLQHKKAKKHLVDLYQIAIQNKFRFYSFGDAMLII